MRSLVVALLLLALAASPAAAQGLIAEAAESLRTDPVYVDPSAEAGLGAAEEAALERRIDAAGAGPMYIAVLPERVRAEAGGSTEGALLALNEELQRRGTIVLVAGRSLRAGSDDLPKDFDGVTGRVATDAVEEHRGRGLAAILTAFIDDMGRVRDGENPYDSGGGFPWLLVAVGGGGAGLYALSRRRRRQQAQAELEEVKENARDDLIALGDDIGKLDIDVQLPTAGAEARAHYEAAVAAYERANQAFNRARSPEDMEPVGAALEEGRWAMASAQACLEGRPPPERRPPCFFDPRHGPSDRDVEWAPYDGVPRLVPACEADAQRVEHGEDPSPRELVVGGRRVPYWNAGPAYAPYAGGFFGGMAGGLFPGLLMGTMLGGAMFPPVVYGDVDPGGGGGDSGGGGDFGGGGFGGGDFGAGGGFGGGDF